jgi:hypothetical protein
MQYGDFLLFPSPFYFVSAVAETVTSKNSSQNWQNN